MSSEVDDSKEIKFLNVRVPMAVYIAAQKKAADERLKFQQLINHLLDEWLNETGKHAIDAGSEAMAAHALDVMEVGRQQGETEYALALLAWLRNPRLDAQKPFGQFVLDEFERELTRKRK